MFIVSSKFSYKNLLILSVLSTSIKNVQAKLVDDIDVSAHLPTLFAVSVDKVVPVIHACYSFAP